MARLAVFDSGVGSLSVIRRLEEHLAADLVYLADTKNYPYGTKDETEMKNIMISRIAEIQERVSPDIIIVASNTPTLMLERLPGKSTIGVLPPIGHALEASVSGNVAVLATRSAVKSAGMARLLAGYPYASITTIDASVLVECVESGAFIRDKAFCKSRIHDTLGGPFHRYEIDTATLSSTHLPFLEEMLREEFPDVRFIDPADDIARDIAGMVPESSKCSLRVFATGDTIEFEGRLALMGIDQSVSHWPT